MKVNQWILSVTSALLISSNVAYADTVSIRADHTIDGYIACSPAKESSKVLMKLVDEGTDKLRQSGELQKILDKYGLKDWK